MYRRYYRYNDPPPSTSIRKPSPPPTPQPQKSAPSLSPQALLSTAQKDDLILIGLLALILFGEDKAEIDFPLVLALLYLLLQK